jgi:hypothetical protein
MPQKYRQMADFHEYYSGTRTAPYLTIFIGGNHEASNHLFELYYGGWVAPNIYYLGAANILRLGNLRIAGLSGIWKGYDYRKPHFERLPYNEEEMTSIFHVRELDVRKLMSVRTQVDIGLSHDWPRGIEWHGDWNWLFQVKNHLQEDAENSQLGSTAAMNVFDRLRPAYWFSAHLHVKYPAVVDHAKYNGKALAETISGGHHDSTPTGHQGYLPPNIYAAREEDRPQVAAWQEFGLQEAVNAQAEQATRTHDMETREQGHDDTGAEPIQGYNYEETFKRVTVDEHNKRKLDATDDRQEGPSTPKIMPQLDGCCSSKESPAAKRQRRDPGTPTPTVTNVPTITETPVYRPPEAFQPEQVDHESETTQVPQPNDEPNNDNASQNTGVSSESSETLINGIPVGTGIGTSGRPRVNGHPHINRIPSDAGTIPSGPPQINGYPQTNGIPVDTGFVASGQPQINGNPQINGILPSHAQPVYNPDAIEVDSSSDDDADTPRADLTSQHRNLASTDLHAMTIGAVNGASNMSDSTTASSNTSSGISMTIRDPQTAQPASSAHVAAVLRERAARPPVPQNPILIEPRQLEQMRSGGLQLSSSGSSSAADLPTSIGSPVIAGADHTPVATNTATAATGDTIPDDLRAELATLSSNFADTEAEATADLPFPEDINNTVTHFLALDKCEPRRDFLQLLELGIVSGPSTPLQRPLKLEYDPEWLAILRVFAPELKLGGSPGDKIPAHRGETYYRERIIEEEEWVKENVVKEGKLAVPEDFTVTAPVYDAGVEVEVSEMPREVTNPQTVGFCGLIGIECPFDVGEEERDERVNAGPREGSGWRGGRGGRRGGRGRGRRW